MKVVLKLFLPLKEYFKRAAAEKNADEKVKSMCFIIHEPITELYLEFMTYDLQLLCDFNLLFQSERPPLHVLKAEVTSLIRKFCSSYMDQAELKLYGVHINHEKPSFF